MPGDEDIVEAHEAAENVVIYDLNRRWEVSEATGRIEICLLTFSEESLKKYGVSFSYTS